MERKILLLFDSMDIRDEVVRFAMTLAARMGAGVIMLLLIRSQFETDGAAGTDAQRIQALYAGGEAAMKPWLQAMALEDVPATGILRVGEPASELLKFLAEGHDFDTVVWGGDKKILGERRPRLGEHWMARIMDKLGRPMVAP
jgi:hypothetical protein